MQDHHIRLTLDTTFGPGSARQEAYRNMVSTSMDVIFDRCESDRFQARAELLRLGDIGLGTLKAMPHTAYRSARTIRRVGVGIHYVNYFVKAGFDGQVRGTRIRVEDGDCASFSQKSTMRLDLNAFDCLLLVIPQSVLERRRADLTCFDGRIIRGNTPQARIFGNALQAAMASAPELSPSFAAALGMNLVDLAIACLSDGGQPIQDQPAVARPKTTRPKLRPHHLLLRIQRFVKAHCKDPLLDAEMVCARFELSRSACYLLFKPVGGIQSFIVSCRVAAARRLAGDRDGAGLTLQDIARSSGFTDERALRRAIRRIHGQSMQEFRQAAVAQSVQDSGESDSLAGFFDTL